MNESALLTSHEGVYPARLCGAPGRQRKAPCRKPAGWGTKHVGVGRCRLHGGNNPIKHGRYSKIMRPRIAELIAEFSADPAPLNTLPEIAFVRALLTDYVERYDEWAAAIIAWHESFRRGEDVGKPIQILDVADAYRMAGEVTKMVERVAKVDALKAIPKPMFFDFMRGVGKAVQQHVNDEQWESIKGALEDLYVQMQSKLAG